MMNEQTEAVRTERDKSERKPWAKPDLIEIPVDLVTASLYSVGGNDGTPTLSNIS